MEIYRLEDPETGVGPYNSPINIDDPYAYNLNEMLLLTHDMDGKHPNANTDDMYIPGENYLFACPSLEKLNQWFDGFMPDLNLIGYRIVKYIVPNEHIIMGRSGKQCIFNVDLIESKTILQTLN